MDAIDFSVINYKYDVIIGAPITGGLCYATLNKEVEDRYSIDCSKLDWHKIRLKKYQYNRVVNSNGIYFAKGPASVIYSKTGKKWFYCKLPKRAHHIQNLHLPKKNDNFTLMISYHPYDLGSYNRFYTDNGKDWYEESEWYAKHPNPKRTEFGIGVYSYCKY